MSRWAIRLLVKVSIYVIQMCEKELFDNEMYVKILFYLIEMEFSFSISAAKFQLWLQSGLVKYGHPVAIGDQYILIGDYGFNFFRFNTFS